MISLKDLLQYTKENADDVSDLAAVHTVETSEQGDPYRKTLISDLRRKYEDKAEEAEREKILDRWT